MEPTAALLSSPLLQHPFISNSSLKQFSTTSGFHRAGKLLLGVQLEFSSAWPRGLMLFNLGLCWSYILCYISATNTARIFHIKQSKMTFLADMILRIHHGLASQKSPKSNKNLAPHYTMIYFVSTRLMAAKLASWFERWVAQSLLCCLHSHQAATLWKGKAYGQLLFPLILHRTHWERLRDLPPWNFSKLG